MANAAPNSGPNSAFPMKRFIPLSLILGITGAALGFASAHFTPALKGSGQAGNVSAGNGKTERLEPSAHAQPNDKTEGGGIQESSASQAGVGVDQFLEVLVLDPVVTNISSPADIWVRFEAVIKSEKPLKKEIGEQIHQDFLAYFHSLKLSELRGASAFLDLKSELLSRAETRANQKIDSIYIKTFLFE